MKKKLSLLLTLIVPFLLINCSGKTNITESIIKSPTRIIYPTVTTRPPPKINNQEQLGTPIKTTSTPPPPIIPIKEEIKKRPNHQNNTVRGTSTLSKRFKLPNTIRESSALIKVDGKLWTVNDSGGKAKLYQISEKNGHILKTVTVKNAYNRDWEALTYDKDYVYIGDFGNNRGNRRDLKIYKIPRKDLKNKKTTRAETIYFTYSDQKNFRSRSRKHNFDCEAMVAYHGKLYLFSKNWQDEKTRLYELSTKLGKQIAKYKDTFNVQGLITDASINKELDILLLSSYSKILSVNVWAFTNFNQENFFKGSSKKLTFNSLNAQIEGITFINDYKAYLSSEAFSRYIFSFDANLYKIDFSREFE